MLRSCLVVEDDGFARLSIASTLQLAGWNTFESESAKGALEIAKTNVVHAAVLDLHLGVGPNGIDLARELRRINSSIGIVILSSFTSPKLLVPTAELPRDSVYLNKSQLRSGETLTQAVKQSFSKAPRIEQPATEIDSLSVSQLETLKLLASGYSNAEIAAARFVTERAVEKSINRLAKQLGQSDQAGGNKRVQLAKYYLQATGLKEDGKE